MSHSSKAVFFLFFSVFLVLFSAHMCINFCGIEVLGDVGSTSLEGREFFNDSSIFNLLCCLAFSSHIEKLKVLFHGVVLKLI